MSMRGLSFSFSPCLSGRHLLLSCDTLVGRFLLTSQSFAWMKGIYMAKFMCTHTFPPGQFSAEQIRELAQAAQEDPIIRGYRAFANTAEGKAICVMEAPTKEAVAAWFTEMGMPFDTITRVELEGDRGNVQST